MKRRWDFFLKYFVRAIIRPEIQEGWLQSSSKNWVVGMFSSLCVLVVKSGTLIPFHSWKTKQEPLAVSKK